MSLPASRCPTCDRVDLPPAQRCPVCTGPTEATKLGDRGTVLARTRGMDGTWVLLVGLDGGARTLARADHPAPSIGDGVTLVRAEAGGPLRVPR